MCPSRLPYFFSLSTRLVFNISLLRPSCLNFLQCVHLSSIFLSLSPVFVFNISLCPSDVSIFVFHIFSFNVCPSCVHLSSYFFPMCPSVLSSQCFLLFMCPSCLPYSHSNVCPSRLPYFFHCSPVLSSIFPSMCVHLVFNIPFQCVSILPSIFLSLFTCLVFTFPSDVCPSCLHYSLQCVHLCLPYFFHCLPVLSSRDVSILSSIFLFTVSILSSIFSTVFLSTIFPSDVSIFVFNIPLCVHLCLPYLFHRLVNISF
ncbi:unnamed protein product [Acanthosepion pharaonis]|uniref:Uncharacterized protein n=1 Tax=Acanthosepion pharaonis TaxID=158019 RepID=A0A812C065_ACAPH|nr:unnamed protein product [Sepia pharaonis]